MSREGIIAALLQQKPLPPSLAHFVFDSILISFLLSQAWGFSLHRQVRAAPALQVAKNMGRIEEQGRYTWAR